MHILVLNAGSSSLKYQLIDTGVHPEALLGKGTVERLSDPAAAKSVGQVTGGLAQAIGMVLLEEAGYDARGNPIAATYKDYLLPAIRDVPVFEFLHANTPAKGGVGGMRGVGEGGAIIGPPTLVNATMETYFQYKNCFGCHNGAAINGLSHIFGTIKPLPLPKPAP
jgi:hypothetical protein